MLRITTQNDKDVIRLRLDGKLAGAWVDELERSWYCTARNAGGKPILLDLAEVTFIDAEGRKLLKWLYEQGAELRAAGCMTTGIVEEIKRGI